MSEASDRVVADPAELRRAMSRFATGVAVITTGDDAGPQGMTVNSLTSVSLEPPLLLVCLNAATRTAAALLGSGRFAVNILGARQEGCRASSRGAARTTSRASTCPCTTRASR